jgi:adenosylcobinamide-phosphate synthase
VTPRTDLSERLAGSALGYLLDRILGEPPARLHPLRAFGWLMAWIERHIYRDARRPGVGYATCGIGIGTLVGSCISSTTGATFLSCGGRALGEAAGIVDRALRDADLTSARDAAHALVGRDTEHLGESELARAAVESVAENTVDAIIAPLVFAAVGGAAGALGYRAANTLDALVGHRNERYERFGWASARLDDALSFVPARLTALLVVLVRPCRAAEVLRVVRRDAPAHPSPNAGIAEAAFAAALGLRLGGASTYGGVEDSRPPLGSGRAPERRDIARAVRLSHDVGKGAAATAAVGSLWLRARRRRPKSIHGSNA